MQRLACNVFLSDLTLEFDAVGVVLGHGFHPWKARRPRSIPNPRPVHRQGRTPPPDAPCDPGAAPLTACPVRPGRCGLAACGECILSEPPSARVAPFCMDFLGDSPPPPT